jgi:hypothetical protein
MDKKNESLIEQQRKELNSLTTKRLLHYRDKALACGGIGYDPTNSHGAIIPIGLIYEVLNTREHVLNKKESRAKRREMAIRNKGKSHNKDK